MTIRKTLPLLFLLAAVLCTSLCMARQGGALFFQVHYTSEQSHLKLEDAMAILTGKVKSFKELRANSASRMHIYVDAAIADQVKKHFPGLSFKAASFKIARDIPRNKFSLAICDLRGLRADMKTLYIDRTLPWGTIDDNYCLSPEKSYPLTLTGAEDWNDKEAIQVVQTGVTAMTRAFIPAVARSGDLLSPVRYTKKITAGADIAMTSNEVSFLSPCTYPFKDRMLFCSPIKFFNILTASGFDVIELTGNHNNDYGYRHNAETMKMIENSGMIYFGGGKNRSDARRTRFTSIKGMRLAFTGFNELGPPSAWSAADKPGAARLSKKLFSNTIRNAAGSADIVFVTVQWGNENSPRPWRIQKEYFRRAADLGAHIIVSSSAHRAMGIEFYRGKFISYGLGNFLFDQMQTVNHRRGIIARHHFYKGRHIETELIPYMIHNYSQPRLLHGREARSLLKEVFHYSLGPVFK